MGASDAFQGTGTVFKNFYEGYRQARDQQRQQGLDEENARWSHAGRLFDLADRVNDPKMKDSLYASATQMLDAAENPPKKAAGKGGIGSLLGNMFGIGRSKPQVPPSGGVTTGPQDPKVQMPAELKAPEQATPGSQTYGNLGDMFGDELQNRMGTIRENASAVAEPRALPPNVEPPPYDMKAMNTQGMVPREHADLGPARLTSAPGTPVVREYPSIASKPGPVFQLPQTQAEPPAAPAAAAAPPPGGQPSGAPGGRQAAQGLPQLPSSMDIINEAKREAAATYGDKAPFQSQAAASQAAISKAQNNAKKLLQITDQHLMENGHLKTALDASNDPVHGADFRNVMDTVGEYESAGLLPRGYLKNWQDQRFNESAKYDPNATAADATGQHFQVNPQTGRFDLPIGSAAAPKAQTHEEIVNKVWEKDPATWTTQDTTIINGEKARLDQMDRSKMSREEQLKTDSINELAKGVKNGPNFQALKTYMAVAHPVTPPVSPLEIMYNKDTGHNEYAIVDRADPAHPKVAFTGISDKAQFNPGNYSREYTPTSVSPQNPNIQIQGEKVSTLSAGKILSAADAGLDPALTPDVISSLLSNGAFADPEDQRKVTTWLAAKRNPFATPARGR